MSFALSLFLLGSCFPWTSDGQTFFIRAYRTKHRRLLRAQHVESSAGITFPRAGKWYFRLSFLWKIDMAMVAQSCHFALDLLCQKEGVYESA